MPPPYVSGKIVHHGMPGVEQSHAEHLDLFFALVTTRRVRVSWSFIAPSTPMFSCNMDLTFYGPVQRSCMTLLYFLPLETVTPASSTIARSAAFVPTPAHGRAIFTLATRHESIFPLCLPSRACRASLSIRRSCSTKACRSTLL